MSAAAELVYEPLQPWWCRQCGVVGMVPVPADASPGAILDRVSADHKSESPACHKACRLSHVLIVETVR